MSVLVIEVNEHGIVMGADRNLTHSIPLGISIGQSQRSKIIRLPDKKGLVGYVGCATVGNMFMDEWIQDFIYRNVKIESLESFVINLKDEIQFRKDKDWGSLNADGIIIHVCGFEKDSDKYYPLVYRIANMEWNPTRNEYLKATKKFYFDQHILYQNTITKQNIRDFYKVGNVGWFHQGFDLGAYNTIDTKLNEAFLILAKSEHPKHPKINSIKQVEPYIKMKVLSYGAYFSSFFLPNEQYVGGGADVLSLTWPET